MKDWEYMTQEEKYKHIADTFNSISNGDAFFDGFAIAIKIVGGIVLIGLMAYVMYSLFY